VIVPQQEGDFTLPPEKITFQYAAVPGKPTPGVVTLPPRKFSAKLPVGAKTEEGAIPGARVPVKQTLDRGVQRLHVGDAITRRLDIFASHTQAVMIPPPSFEAPPGVRVYHKDPQLSDVTAERGEFVGGRRVDVATYVFDQPGTYVLPEIDLRWYNPVSDHAEMARAPQIEISVAPNPDTQPAIAPEAAPVAAAPEAPQQRVDWQPWLKWGVVALGSLSSSCGCGGDTHLACGQSGGQDALNGTNPNRRISRVYSRIVGRMTRRVPTRLLVNGYDVAG
jgi:hypothetical protein